MLLALIAALGTAEMALAEEGQRIAIIDANFEGTSPERENLNTEWVEIKNSGNETQDLGGWTLMDGQNHIYTFPEFSLKPESSVKVHTGEGKDTAGDLFWGSGTSIWNNSGDVATLKDASGNVVDTYPEDAPETEA